MASRNYHKNRTKERKARQHKAARVQRMRQRLMQFESMSATRVARMSVQELESQLSRPHRRKMVTPMDGLALAMAASGLLRR